MATALASQAKVSGMTDMAMQEIQQAQELKNKAAQLSRRLEEISIEVGEHTRVLDTLKEVNSERICYRRVGELLVERTVQQVIPELEENLSRMVSACKKLDEQRISFEKEASEILKKHSGSLEELGRRRVLNEQLGS